MAAYTIFNGEFDWHNGNWWQLSDEPAAPLPVPVAQCVPAASRALCRRSNSLNVVPGDVITSSTTYDASANAYVLAISNANASRTITSRLAVKYNDM